MGIERLSKSTTKVIWVARLGYEILSLAEEATVMNVILPLSEILTLLTRRSSSSKGCCHCIFCQEPPRQGSCYRPFIYFELEDYLYVCLRAIAKDF